MATYYSNHFGPAVGATGHFTTLRTPMTPVSVGLNHARKRVSMAHIVVPDATNLADNDVIRILDMHSNQRLIAVIAAMDANWGANAHFNLGIYRKGSNNDGAVVDEDLFGANIDWSGAIDTDYFATGALDAWDRGKQLWELANIGLAAATYSATTDELWTLAATTNENVDAVAAAVEMYFEVLYTAGD